MGELSWNGSPIAWGLLLLLHTCIPILAWDLHTLPWDLAETPCGIQFSMPHAHFQETNLKIDWHDVSFCRLQPASLLLGTTWQDIWDLWKGTRGSCNPVAAKTSIWGLSEVLFFFEKKVAKQIDGCSQKILCGDLRPQSEATKMHNAGIGFARLHLVLAKKSFELLSWNTGLVWNQ